MILKAISIDDEPRAHHVIEHYAAKIDELELIERFTSPLKAASYLNEHSIDLIFLDINMPDMDGISLIRTLKNPPAVIFTTAYDQFAVESYDLYAAGYLLKPIEFPKFYKAVMRVVEQSQRKRTRHFAETAVVQSIVLKSGSKMVNVNPADIHYIDAYGNYSEIVFEDRKLITDQSLSDLLDNYLPPTFIRIHRSHVINTAHLDEFDNYEVTIKSRTLPIGKTYRKEVKVRLMGG